MKAILFCFIIFSSITYSYTQSLWEQFLYPNTYCEKSAIFLPSMPACAIGNYYLVFEDNFDGNELDQNKWNVDLGVTRDFNFSQEKQWWQAENAVVSNGTLKIVAKEFETPYEVTYLNWTTTPWTNNTSTFKYSSANISTKEAFYFGKYEIRCRLPEGLGFWPAFWTFGGPGWNEIDFFEMHGHEINRFTGNVHHDFDGDGSSENCGFAIEDAADFSEWHIITCIFEFDRVTWFLDGNEGPTLYRFSTLTGQPVSCSEDIAVGTYLQEVSFPSESMNIILNLSLHYPVDEPDETTPFPSNFEIDYVRYYQLMEDEPCDGCLELMNYANINNLPSTTRVLDYIIAGENTIVQNGQNVEFKAGNFINLDGLITEPNGIFSATIEDCNFSTFTEIPISYIGHNALDGYQVIQCVNPIYEINAVGFNGYQFRVYTEGGALLYNSNGIPTSNTIISWDASQVAVGWYRIEVELFNCTESYFNEYWILVFDQCGKQSQHTEKSDPISELVSLEPHIIVYPNPTNKNLNIQYKLLESKELKIIMFDMMGKELYKIENIAGKSGTNFYTYDVSQFVEGTYLLKIITKDDVSQQVFVISK